MDFEGGGGHTSAHNGVVEECRSKMHSYHLGLYVLRWVFEGVREDHKASQLQAWALALWGPPLLI